MEVEEMFDRLCRIAVENASKEEINPTVFGLYREILTVIPMPPFRDQAEKEHSFGLVREILRRLSPEAVAVILEARSLQNDILVALLFSRKGRISRVWKITPGKTRRRLEEVETESLELTPLLDLSDIFKSPEYIT